MVIFKNNIIKFVCYICNMRVVIDNMKSEHLKWFTELARTLQFKVTEIELTEDEEAEEDAYLLQAMLEVKNEKPISDDEALEFEKWLKASVESQK